LKKGKFNPADAGQLNFYLNVLDEKVKLQHENSSIGIVLCKEKNNTVVKLPLKVLTKLWVWLLIKPPNKRRRK
jgi:YhcG PDDEXK nuclease domain